MGYGFRLYSVRLVKGVQGSKGLSFEAVGMDGKTHLSAWLDRCFNELEKHETLTKVPRLRVAAGDERLPIEGHFTAKPERNDPQIRWKKHTTKQQKITFEIQYGTVGRYDVAMAPESKDDADISTKSASHTFRGIIYLPKKGDVGVLALEVVDGASPVEVVHSWLARAAIECFEQDKKAISELPTGRAAELVPAIFKINFKQVANLPKLKKMLKESSAAELVLRKMEISSSGKATKEKIKLVNKVTTKGERQKIFDFASNLVKAAATDAPAAAKKQNALVELEGIVGTDVSGLDFNDGHVVVDDGNGRKKIGPNHLDQFFVYPVSDDLQPTDITFEQAVAKEVVEMTKLLKTKLDVS